MSELLALGISHKTAPVALRERLAFSEREASEFARQATATAEVREAVVISTCNRTEVYLVVGDPVRAESDVLGLLARRAEIRPTELAEAIYSPRNCDAARQLYRVTAGLESMILGEAEIQGQVRRAHEAAMRAGATGPLTNRLFAAALTTGKRVRSETGIGSSRVSVPSVAVDLALSVLGGLRERHVVILGAGETSELTARALAEQGAGTIFVANRHADRALSLAQRFGGSVVGLDGLPDQLVRADIVLSLDLLSASDRRPRGARAGDGRARAADAAAADRHRRAARHRPGVRRAGGREPVRHRRPAGGRRAQPEHARRGDAAGAGDRRGGDPPLRALARPARRAAHGQRAARRTATRSSSRCWPRTPGAGSRPPRATSRASRRSRGRS